MLLSLFGLVGCGSLLTVIDNSYTTPTPYFHKAEISHCGIYQGVVQDFDLMDSSKPLGVLLSIVDLPFSFVAGTVALPYTITTFGDCGKYKYSCDEIGNRPREDCPNNGAKKNITEQRKNGSD